MSALADILAAKRARPYTADQTVEALRRESEEAGRKAPLPAGVHYRSVSAGGVPAEWIEGPGTEAERTFLFIHGGGYYRGSVAASRATAARIGLATGAPILSVDYRLAPEHPFPAAIDDVHAAYRWLLGEGRDPRRTLVGGVSAGGGLTLALLLAARDAGDPLPAAAVPMSPWTDLTQSGESFRTRADADPIISKAYLDRMAGYYLAGADPRTPLASPLYADLAGLPALLIQVGTAETMLSDSIAFAERAIAAGIDVTLEQCESMFHGFQGSAHLLAEAEAAIDRIGAFYRRHAAG